MQAEMNREGTTPEERGQANAKATVVREGFLRGPTRILRDLRFFAVKKTTGSNHSHAVGRVKIPLLTNPPDSS
ncbi:MAG: hypothetical protein FD146_782 [Anaerolineaceae bacterium]|nr:MAG: hypothetical protein FD146_782 [Anaerolineaceae bacterium]